MREIAPGLFHLPVLPFSGVNVYFADGVLFDAGVRQSAGKILKALRGHEIVGHALTHAHPDHQGASHAVCTALNVPLSCGAGDADAMERGDHGALIPDNPVARLAQALWAGPPHSVAWRLAEGDEVGGFTVIQTPGHSPGHVAYWRERDRVLLLGDVLRNMSYVTLRPGLREPPAVFTPDPARNRASARKLLGLNPRVVGFGHGAPLHDPGPFNEFISGLAA
jgi:hydroxyacylglutathione hydrolase